MFAVSMLPRLKSSVIDVRFKIIKFECIKSPTAFYNKGRYSSDQEKLPHNTTATQKALAWRPYIVTRLNFIGLLHYDVTTANSLSTHWS